MGEAQEEDASPLRDQEQLGVGMWDVGSVRQREQGCAQGRSGCRWHMNPGAFREGALLGCGGRGRESRTRDSGDSPEGQGR